MININALSQKIIHKDKLKNWIAYHRFFQKKIVFTNGCFDIIHKGHLHYLAEAKNLGDVLIIGLNSDKSVKQLKGESRPIQQENDRALLLASLIFIDAIIIFEEETPLNLINQIKPSILVKGGDYTLENIVGAKEVFANGGEVKIIPFVEGYSSSSILGRI